MMSSPPIFLRLNSISLFPPTCSSLSEYKCPNTALHCLCSFPLVFVYVVFALFSLVLSPMFLHKSDKGQIFHWSSQTALGSGGCLFVDCHHAQKPENCPISDLFNLTPKYVLALLPFTDLVPPSTDPVPPSTNQYRPKLTQYHHV